LVKFTLSS